MKLVHCRIFIGSVILGQTMGCAFQERARAWPYPTLPPNIRWQPHTRSPGILTLPTPAPQYSGDFSKLTSSGNEVLFDNADSTLDSPLFLNRFDLNEVTRDVVVNRTIIPFSIVSEEDVDELKRKYLVDPYIQSLQYEKLVEYFHVVFPRKKARAENDPKYLNPSLLVDFSYMGPDGLPERLHSNDEEAIIRAEKGLQRAIEFAENADLRDQGWRKDLRYYFKLMLEELDENPDFEKIKLAIVIMASVGQHCGPGNTQGLEMISRIFFNQDPLSYKSPASIAEQVAQRLDGLREEIFLEAVSFANDRQTAHTVNHYRNSVASKLGIHPGFRNDPHKTVAMTPLSESEVIDRFFRGKVGNPASSVEEERRSHRGYTPRVIAKTIASWMNEHQEVIPEIKRFFAEKVNRQSVRIWADENQSEILKSLSMESEEVLENQKTFSELPWDVIVNSYLEAKYFQFDGRYWCLNTQGLRKLLIDLKVYIETS